MSGFVLDCSIALAWVFPDETSDAAIAILERLEHEAAVVPGIWRLEIANGLTIGERKGRLSVGDITAFLDTLALLPIEVDRALPDRALGPVLDLARQERMTAYEAAYLDLALVQGNRVGNGRPGAGRRSKAAWRGDHQIRKQSFFEKKDKSFHS